MELKPRDVMFVHDVMDDIENADDRQSYEQAAAARVRGEAESILTE
jgi:hypothetical protein